MLEIFTNKINLRMNRLSLISICCLFFTIICATPTNAQATDSEVNLIQSIYGMEKRAVIAEFLGDTVDNTFWDVYEAYELERKALGKARINLLNEYVEKYSELKGDLADALVNKAEKLGRSNDKLISQYTKKVRKVAGSEVAAQFYQIEHYLLSATQAEIFENIPFIGDLREN
jgi:hypothetical protein